MEAVVLALIAILVSLFGIGYGVAKVYERLGGVVERVNHVDTRVKALEEKMV